MDVITKCHNCISVAMFKPLFSLVNVMRMFAHSSIICITIILTRILGVGGDNFSTGQGGNGGSGG